MENLIWHNETRIVKTLIEFKNNPRLELSESQIDTLKKSVNKFNLVEIPVIDLNNKIIAGHQRIKILILLGRGNEEIDVRVPNRELTEEELKEYNLRSNISIGIWNYDILKDFDPELLLTVGFDDFNFSQIFDDALGIEDDNFDVEQEVAKIKIPKTRIGDLIMLGRHKVICADSQNPQAIARLVGEEKISMLNFDPIYNIDLDYNNGFGKKGKYGGKVKDKKTDEEYKQFLKGIFQNGLAHTLPDTHVFCWCDQRYIGLIQNLYAELGITNRRVCLWIKNSQNPTPQIAFNKAYEPCAYGTIGTPYLSPNVKNLNEILNKEIGTGNRLPDDIMDLFNIWLVKRVSGQEYEHPTQKPPSLYEKAFRRCSKPGDIILDLFGGSGSQLVAAEQLKRRAFLCEIDPIFCDVIVNRYKALTGKEAIYVGAEK